jgi:hypothetical protein
MNIKKQNQFFYHQTTISISKESLQKFTNCWQGWNYRLHITYMVLSKKLKSDIKKKELTEREEKNILVNARLRAIASNQSPEPRQINSLKA